MMWSSDDETTNDTTLLSIDGVTAECIDDDNIENRLCAQEKKIDLSKFPITALQSETKIILSKLLNPTKYSVENGFPRDWRGVLLCALPNANVESITSSNQMKQVLHVWYQEDRQNATLERLEMILKKIDRWDALDDTNYFADDCAKFLENQNEMDLNMSSSSGELTSYMSKSSDTEKYDAIVLFAEEDSEFGAKIVLGLEKKGFKIFEKDRDLDGGVLLPNEAVRQRISQCCKHLIIVFSNEFFRSPVNQFLINFALWKGIAEIKRLVIPCLIKPCKIPEPWDSFCLLLYYKKTPLYNFWGKLIKSISGTPDPLVPVKTNNLCIGLPEIEYNTTNTMCTGLPEIEYNVIKSQESSTLCMSQRKILSPKPQNKIVPFVPTPSTIDHFSNKLPMVITEEPSSPSSPSSEKVKSSKGKPKWFSKIIKPKKIKAIRNEIS